MEELVILVDEQDNIRGTMPKLEAHQKNELHRAFSILIWNSNNEMLIQQRAEGKYHSAGLWTNACCSHPRSNETTIEAANRRLQEEIGIKTELKHSFHFTYQVSLENNLFEHELDHVFIGKCDEEPLLNPEEVKAFRWISLADLKTEIATKPDQFTFWFKYILENFSSKIFI